MWYNFCMITKAIYKFLLLFPDDDQAFSFKELQELSGKDISKTRAYTNLLIDQGMIIKLTDPDGFMILPKGIVAKDEYQEYKKLNFFKQFIYPALVAIIGVIVGAIISA